MSEDKSELLHLFENEKFDVVVNLAAQAGVKYSIENPDIYVIDQPAVPSKNWSGLNPDPSSSKAPYRIFNIGNNRPIELLDFIKEIEKNLRKKAKLERIDIQAGDVEVTWADVDDLVKNFNYKPETTIKAGLKKFIDWYKQYYSINK